MRIRTSIAALLPPACLHTPTNTIPVIMSQEIAFQRPGRKRLQGLLIQARLT